MNKLCIIAIMGLMVITLSGCMGGGGGGSSDSGGLFSDLADSLGGSEGDDIFIQGGSTGNGTDIDSNTTVNPEPATMALLGTGLLGMIALKRKKKV